MIEVERFEAYCYRNKLTATLVIAHLMGRFHKCRTLKGKNLILELATQVRNIYYKEMV